MGIHRGCLLILLSCVLTGSAYAGGLPQTISLPGPRTQPVYNLNAPPEPVSPARMRTPLAAPTPGVVHLNAPSTRKSRNCRFAGLC
jgi:hypothetical protein